MAAPRAAATMRIAPLTLAFLAFVSTLPAFAAANLSHDGCGTSDQRVLVLDVWTTQCTGVVFSQPPCLGMTHHEDVPAPPTNFTVHVLALSGWGCQTGVLVEPAP